MDNSQENGSVRVARVVGPGPLRVGIPLMTLALMLVNLLMALAQFAGTGFRWSGPTGEIGNYPVDWALGAKVPSLIAHGEYWRLVTASFLHGDWMHLLANMVSLLILGWLIEGLYGPLRMLVIYVIACVAGVVVSYAAMPGVSLGASTGVFGLVGALLAHNARYRRNIPERLRWFFPVMLLVLAIQMWRDLSNEQVDIWGHMGGLAGGVLMASLLESRTPGTIQRDRDWLPLPTALLTALGFLAYGAFGLVTALPGAVDLLRAGRAVTPQAQSVYLERVLRGRPYFVEAQIQLADQFLRMNQDDEAARRYRQALAEHPSSRLIRNRLDALAEDYYARAQALFERNQYEAALQLYGRGTDYAVSDQQRAKVHNGYAWTLADKLNRDLDEAERHAEIAARAEPENAAIADTLAWVYYKQRRYPEALNQQLAAVRMADRDRRWQDVAELYFHLAAIYEALGDRDKARTNYGKVIQLRPSGSLNDPLEGGRRAAAAGLEELPPPAPGTPPREADPAVERGII